MFDVRPVNEAGELDLEKIHKTKKVVKLERKRLFPKSSKKIGDVFHDVKHPDHSVLETNRFQNLIVQEKIAERKPSYTQVPITDEEKDFATKIGVEFKNEPELPDYFARDFYDESVIFQEDADYFQKFEATLKKKKERWRKFSSLFNDKDSFGFKPKKTLWTFAGASLGILILVFGVNFASSGFKLKNTAMDSGQKAYADLMEAKTNITDKNFDEATIKFSEAYEQFNEISKDFEGLGGVVIETSKFLPGASKISSGAHLAAAGKDISQIGINLSGVLKILGDLKNPMNSNNDSPSILSIFQETDKNLRETSVSLTDLEENLKGINMDDIPEEQRGKISALSAKLPEINAFVASFLANDKIFTDILGGNGPRKYLILFQNNQEMRPTGGFIGSYALVDMANGKIRNMKIDGIFNPDGQLLEKVVPPAPIGKISAAWSLHDSNWFPNFPTSAEKASWFYEKTGGPTVDGIITITPTVMQKLLAVTGPIEMPEYGVTVDKDNFIEKIQEEVEVNYDKELNQPKKILADLAPILLDRMFSAKDIKTEAKILDILGESLNQKHILIYSKNYDIEKTVSKMGWSGEILNTPKDYLSVINTNINGFKTDGMIDETINHTSQIQEDGSIIDTIAIKRHHNGGNTPYDFWNKVNSDYMRVYVPKGSKLLSASGQTRETNQSPLDYNSLGFKRDPQVQMEEDSAEIDDVSGTKIYNDSEKTVFANWVYVSPQETVEVKYTYLLPFRINLDSAKKNLDSYSLLAQKQSGSLGSKFDSTVTYPDKYKVIWKYPENASVSDLPDNQTQIKIETDLVTDKFMGMAFSQ